MKIAGLLVFSLAAVALSFLIGRSRDLDRGRIAAYVALVAWGSLLWGFYLARFPK